MMMMMIMIKVIIMGIYKAATLRPKALIKHSITHIMYIEMENVIRIIMITVIIMDSDVRLYTCQECM